MTIRWSLFISVASYQPCMPVRVLIQPPLCNESNVGIWTCSSEPPNDRPPLRIKFSIVFPQPNINATLSRASTYSATNKLNFVHHVFWRLDKLVAVVIPLVFFMELVKLRYIIWAAFLVPTSQLLHWLVQLSFSSWSFRCLHRITAGLLGCSRAWSLCAPVPILLPWWPCAISQQTWLDAKDTLLPPKTWPETLNLCRLWCTRYLENFQGTSAPPTSWETWCDLPWIIMTLVIIEIQGQLQESEQLLLWQFMCDYQRLKSV